jgi:hypothetical protein
MLPRNQNFLIERGLLMITSRIMRKLSVALLLCVVAPLSAYAESTFQVSNAHVFGTDTAVAGAGTLLRENDGVELRVQMDGLDSNTAYTLWWVIFNNPAACEHGAAPVLCGLGDVGGPADTAVLNAAAFISSPSGTGNTTAELDEGPTPAGVTIFGQLNDPVGAEIHVIIQSHGRPLVGSVAEQMTMDGGACNHKCENQFAIVFLPVGP